MPEEDGLRPLSEFRDEIRAAEVISLHELLSARITKETLSDWAGESSPRHDFLATTVWCVIRWAKQLGVPRGPSFASGFSMVHDYEYIEYAQDASGIQPISSDWRAPKVGPVLIGSAEDATHYSTSILMHPELLWENRLRVSIAPNSWNPLPVLAESGAGSFRLVRPTEQRFTYQGSGRPAFLRDIEMIARDVWTL